MLTLDIALLTISCVLGTGFLALFAERTCTILGMMDEPGDRKLHKQPTPLVGGLALACAILPTLVLAVFFSVEVYLRQMVLFAVLATFAMSLIGMADDRHSLEARDRILLSILVFVSISILDHNFIVRALKFESIGVEFNFSSVPYAVAFTTLCCVGLVNAVNMADGKNGLVIGLCILWVAILGSWAPVSFFPMVIILEAGLTVLFVFNMMGRLFLGDGGSYGFATVIGLLAIMTYNSANDSPLRSVSAEQVMALFAVPVLDSFRLTVVRIARGQSPMAADRDHLHHHMQNALGWPLGLFVYLAMALVPTAVLYWVD